MITRGHLRLVTPEQNYAQKSFAERLREILENIFTSRTEKIYVLKDILNRMYRDYEITTGIKDIPYFVKAETKIKQIIYENKVDYYYGLYKKYKKDLESR